MGQARVKQKVFFFSKPSVGVSGGRGGNNRPDTGPLFLDGYEFKWPNVSVV